MGIYTVNADKLLFIFFLANLSFVSLIYRYPVKNLKKVREKKIFVLFMGKAEIHGK